MSLRANQNALLNLSSQWRDAGFLRVLPELSAAVDAAVSAGYRSANYSSADHRPLRGTTKVATPIQLNRSR